MKRIDVKAGPCSYQILVGHGLLADSGKHLLERTGRVARAALITNPIVGGHYGESTTNGLSTSGFDVRLCEAPDGERYKTLATVETLYEQLLEIGMDRHGVVLALGGGVIGDIAGFVAATFMRGVPFVQIPTTLLAMVDASIGGKTGVDLPQGKNMVGAFKQPELVLVDLSVLTTLPAPELANGMAEALKHGIIGSPSLFEALEKEKPMVLEEIVVEAIRVKVDVVQRDPLEKGVRAVLNLGHTFGHALELVSGYKMRHGEAVSLGMVAAAKMSEMLGMCDAGLVGRVEGALKTQSLPVRIGGFTVDEVVTAMRHDKKRKEKHLRFAVPIEPGTVEIVENPPDRTVREATAWILSD